MLYKCRCRFRFRLILPARCALVAVVAFAAAIVNGCVSELVHPILICRLCGHNFIYILLAFCLHACIHVVVVVVIVVVVVVVMSYVILLIYYE